MPREQRVHLVFHHNSRTVCNLSIGNLRYFVEEKEKVTCKNCLKWMNSGLGIKLGWGTNLLSKKLYSMKWTIAIEVERGKRKTRIFNIYNRSSREIIGKILWNPGWRCYVFDPCYRTVWSSGCLQEIITIMNELMEEWRMPHARRK